jgi:hypothetical protein
MSVTRDVISRFRCANRILKKFFGLVGQTFLSDKDLSFCSKMTGKNACPTVKNSSSALC